MINSLSSCFPRIEANIETVGLTFSDEICTHHINEFKNCLPLRLGCIPPSADLSFGNDQGMTWADWILISYGVSEVVAGHIFGRRN